MKRHEARRQDVLSQRGGEIVAGTIKGVARQLEQMPKGQRVEALRAIGAALRPFCPEAADYLESVE